MTSGYANALIAPNTYRRIVTSYVDGVLRGDVVVGERVKQACERHQRDIERQTSDDDFPYEMDWRAAELACMFFPMRLRHWQGRWAGQPFDLEPWQAFIIASVFGWKRADRTRRFRKAYVSVARKNGKTELAAGVMLKMLTVDGEQGAQVFAGATKQEQAALVHRAAEGMVRSSPALARQIQIHKLNMSVEQTGSYMRPLGSDKPFDGLGPSCVTFDELHAWKEHHRGFYDSMRTGGAARMQPLELSITTAGTDKSLLWIEADDYARGVVMGDIVDETLFGFVASLDPDDDPFDESTWEKANPNLGVSVSLEYLREQAREAQSKPTAKNAFIRFHCNRRTSSVEDAITRKLWNSARGELSEWSTADYVGGGIDLGGRDDLAGSAFCARFPLPPPALVPGRPFMVPGKDPPQLWRYEISAKGFIAEDARRDLTQQPWAQWIHEGYLRCVKYVIASLRDEFLEDAAAHGCRSVAFDPHQVRQLGDEIEAAGIEATEMPQNPGQFNEPIEEFLQALKDGRITHDGHPVLRWCALNVSLKTNSKGEWMADKEHSRDKIDLFVAVLMAFRETYFAEVEQGWALTDGATW